MKFMTFSSDEYNVLNKIATKTKADCWFWLDHDDNGNDIILDLEENKQLEIEEGVGYLLECASDEANYKYCDLTLQEKATFYSLIKKLNISMPPCVRKEVEELGFDAALKLLKSDSSMRLSRAAWDCECPRYIYLKHFNNGNRIFMVYLRSTVAIKEGKEVDATGLLLSEDLFADDWYVY